MFGKNSICWTGHRTLEKVFFNHLNPTSAWSFVQASVCNYAKRAYAKGWYNHVVGGALGVDMLVGLVIRDMITSGGWPKLQLHLCIPHPDYNNRWIKPRDFEALESLKRICGDARTHVLNTGVYNSKTAGRILNQRNEFMVDNTTITTAIWDGRVERSGTYNCMSYAKNHRDMKIVCVMKPLVINEVTGMCDEEWNTP